MIRDHRKLRAYELANAFAVSVYRETRRFPAREMFGLTSQMRRAAVSAPANIVEGCGRESLNEYAHFLNLAFGSLREAGYYIDLAEQLEYLAGDRAAALRQEYEEAARVLAGLKKSLRAKC